MWSAASDQIYRPELEELDSLKVGLIYDTIRLITYNSLVRSCSPLYSTDTPGA
jgi:hypothetical protein